MIVVPIDAQCYASGMFETGGSALTFGRPRAVIISWADGPNDHANVRDFETLTDDVLAMSPDLCIMVVRECERAQWGESAHLLGARLVHQPEHASAEVATLLGAMTVARTLPDCWVNTAGSLRFDGNLDELIEVLRPHAPQALVDRFEAVERGEVADLDAARQRLQHRRRSRALGTFGS